MNTASIIIAVIGAVLTLVSVTLAIFTFYFNRKKESKEDGSFQATVQKDIAYIREGVDELKHDSKGMKADIRELDHRVTLVEASTKSAHHRIDDIERRIP